MPRTRTTATDRREQRTSQPRATPEERRAGGRASSWDGTLHEFVVQKPYCTPCRSNVYTALNQYGVPVYRYEEWVKTTSVREAATIWKLQTKSIEGILQLGVNLIPMAQEARFSIPANRAEWVYYLLRSAGQLAIVKGGEQWRNNAHGKQLPKAWNQQAGIEAAVKLEMIPVTPGQARVESSCSDGNDLWKKIQAIREKEEKKPK